MTTHHYPPAPGAVQSRVAPHMWVLGSYKDMLQQDVRLAESLLRRAWADADDAITEWRHTHGDARHANMLRARLAVERVKHRREVAAAALSRLAGYQERDAA